MVMRTQETRKIEIGYGNYEINGELGNLVAINYGHEGLAKRICEAH